MTERIFFFLLPLTYWKRSSSMDGNSLLTRSQQVSTTVILISAQAEHPCTTGMVTNSTLFILLGFSQPKIGVSMWALKKNCTVKVFVSCFWWCPGNSVSSAAHLTGVLVPLKFPKQRTRQGWGPLMGDQCHLKKPFKGLRSRWDSCWEEQKASAHTTWYWSDPDTLYFRFTKPLYWWEKGGSDCGRLGRFCDSDPGIRKVSGSDHQSVVCGRS